MVPKLNRSHMPSSALALQIYFPTDFGSKNLFLKIISSVLWFYSLQHMAVRLKAQLLLGYIRLGSAGVWPGNDFNMKLPSKEIEHSI